MVGFNVHAQAKIAKNYSYKDIKEKGTSCLGSLTRNKERSILREALKNEKSGKFDFRSRIKGKNSISVVF